MTTSRATISGPENRADFPADAKVKTTFHRSRPPLQCGFLLFVRAGNTRLGGWKAAKEMVKKGRIKGE